MEFKKIYKLSEITLNVTDGEHGTIEDDINGKFYLLSCKNVKNGKIIITSNERTINEINYKKIQKRLTLEKNDILLTTVGTIGEMAIIKDNNINYCFQRSVGVIKPNKKIINPYYLYYTLKNEKKQISTFTKGAVQKCLFINDIRNIKVILPNLETQVKIAHILSTIDKKIELNNRMNETLHELVEQQFINLCKRGTTKKLEELLYSISTGSRPKGGAQHSGIPSIGAEKIEKFGVYDYSSEKYISEEYYNKLKNGKLISGDVLLYKDGAYTGKVSMCLNGFPHKKAAVNEHVFILRTKNNWAQNYLYFTLFNKNTREIIYRAASAKAAQPGLNQSELKNIEINICDKNDIINFENYVNPIMNTIVNNALENQILTRLRDTLLPKLMAGEIDIDKINFGEELYEHEYEYQY